MEDKHLDKLFNDHLKDFEIEYDPESWDKLSERLDQVDNENELNEDFDQTIRGRMESLEEPYNQQSWNVLLDKLEAIEAGRIRVLSSKMAEALIMLLLLITFTRYFEVIQIQPDHGEYAVVDVVAHQIMDDEAQSTASTGIGEDLANSNLSASNSINDLASSTTPDNVYASSGEIASASESEASLTEEGFSIERRPQVAKLTTGNEVKPFQDDKLDITHISTADLSDYKEVALIEQIDIEEIDKSNNLWLNKLRQSNKRILTLSTYVTTDFNRIYTPYDKIFNREAYVQNRGGFGAGVGLMVGGERMNMETGVQYSVKNYAPQKLVELFSPDGFRGYQAVTLEEIDLSLVSVPLNFLYRFDNTGRMRFYTLAGISGQLAIKANYEKEHKQLAFPSPYLRDAETEYVNQGNRSLLESKSFNEGILDGGSLKDNLFITLNAGIGAEYLITDKMRIFAQPKYQFNFFNTGLGPNDDRINIFSFQLGTRFDLNR